MEKSSAQTTLEFATSYQASRAIYVVAKLDISDFLKMGVVPQVNWPSQPRQMLPTIALELRRFRMKRISTLVMSQTSARDVSRRSFAVEGKLSSGLRSSTRTKESASSRDAMRQKRSKPPTSHLIEASKPITRKTVYSSVQTCTHFLISA